MKRDNQNVGIKLRRSEVEVKIKFQDIYTQLTVVPKNQWVPNYSPQNFQLSGGR